MLVDAAGKRLRKRFSVTRLLTHNPFPSCRTVDSPKPMPLSISRMVSLSQKGKAGRVASLREEPFPCILGALKQAFDRSFLLSIAALALATAPEGLWEW